MGNVYSTYRKGFPKNLDQPFIEAIDGNVISYRDLEEQSSSYANGFSDLGLRSGDIVSVQVDKSPEVIFIYLACLRSNLIFHPINTAYKVNELSFLLNDANPSVFICEKEIFENFSSLKLSKKPEHIFSFCHDKKTSIQSIKRQRFHELEELQPDFTAALLYSSGTTGQPKGIELSHENISSNAKALKEAWGFNASDSLLHALPIYHVHGLFIALGCVLLSGSKILWLESFNTDQVIKLLPKSTVMMGVPTYYTRLLEESKFDKSLTENIRLFVSGSAPLLEETFKQFRERTGHSILERYGMTETNVICSNPLNGERKPGSVGLPLSNQELRIVDDDGNDVESDVIGNIQIRGQNVFKGYRNLPEKTIEDFSSDGYFNTGDKGYLDSEGYLVIVGRNKDMIISGGLNVYPKEVETLIDELEGVKESAVIGLKDRDLGEKVVAIVIKEENSVLSEDKIIDTLKKDLAGFKVPKNIIFEIELPRNAMGKVQKNILRDNYQ